MGSIITSTSLMAEPMEVSPSQLGLILPDSLDPDESIGPRLLMKFDLPDGFDSSGVDIAWIQFDISVPIERADTTLLLRFYPLTTEWTPGAVNWDTPWNESGGDFIDSLGQLYFLRAGTDGTNRIDVTDIYRLYADSELLNFGLIFTVEHVDRRAYRLLRRLRPRFVNSLRLMID